MSKHWSAIRALFERAAPLFVQATRYEEGSAIADQFARDVDDLFASIPTTEDAGRIGEFEGQIAKLMSDLQFEYRLIDRQIDPEQGGTENEFEGGRYNAKCEVYWRLWSYMNGKTPIIESHRQSIDAQIARNRASALASLSKEGGRG